MMEYYQESICDPGRAGISEGRCLFEMNSSITSTSYLIRSRVAFKEKERLSVFRSDGVLTGVKDQTGKENPPSQTPVGRI